MASFSQRLYSARPFLGSCFVAGIIIALWNPAPRFVFTFAIGLTAGMLILGPKWQRRFAPSMDNLEWQFRWLAYLPRHQPSYYSTIFSAGPSPNFGLPPQQL